MMIHRNLVRLIFFACMMASLTGCNDEATSIQWTGRHDKVSLSSNAAADPARVLATVDGKPVYAEDVNEYLKNGLKASSAEAALQKVIETYLLADEAARREYNVGPDVYIEYRKALARTQLARVGNGFTAAQIPTDVLQQEYERQKNRFVHGVIRNVVHALVAVPGESDPSDTDWDIAREIHRAVADAKTEDEFREAVETVQNRYTQHPVTVEEIFPFDAQTTRLVKPFVTGAFTVNYPSERISKIVRSRFGLHIIFIVSEAEAENRSFQEVKMMLAKELLPRQRRQHVADYLNRLVSDGDVFVYDEILAETGSAKGN